MGRLFLQAWGTFPEDWAGPNGLADQGWREPTLDLWLGEMEVHLWKARLDLPTPRICAFRDTLDVDELERARRFVFHRDRARFIAARGLLRSIVARYLHLEPQEVRFSYHDHGKPALEPSSNSANLSFNLSHSHELALYAFARGRRIGVDIEYVRGDTDHDGIAEQYFSTTEAAALRSLPSVQRTQAFYRCWTRKEAYVKALGEGLSLALDKFTVSLSPGSSPVFLWTEDNTEARCWHLYEPIVARRYVATVVVEGRDLRVKCFAT